MATIEPRTSNQRHRTNPLAALGLGNLPDDYFSDKDASQYRFHIFEDIVRAGGGTPQVQGDLEPWLAQKYQAESSVALYAHVPWCVETCTYCYYWGKVEKRPAMERMMKAERDHADRLDALYSLRDKRVPSVYFGGGTPTVLPADLLEQQLEFFVRSFRLDDDAEVCVEASVSSLSAQKMDLLERYATRLSMGIQSFSDRLLSQVARSFCADRAKETVAEAVRRFPSVNIDLLYGLQGQTEQEWLSSIETAIELGVPSVTAYRVEVRPGTKLWSVYHENPSLYPNERECRFMRHHAKQLLESAGYRENLVGWFLRDTVADTKVYRERWEKQTPCVAFGNHVQSYGRRHFYVNEPDPQRYAERVENGELPIDQAYEISDPMRRLLILALASWKSNRPVPTESLPAVFGEETVRSFEKNCARAFDFGLLERGIDGIRLTEGGKSAVEWLMRDLIEASFPARRSLKTLS